MATLERLISELIIALIQNDAARTNSVLDALAQLLPAADLLELMEEVLKELEDKQPATTLCA